MNPLIVIPTFISGRTRKTGSTPVNTYDHPTALNQPGELPRCLKSLTKVRGLGQIAILVAADPAIEMQAADKIQAICSKFPMLNIIIIGASEQSLIRQRMEQLNLGKIDFEVGLSGYGAIRNLGLVTANVLGFDSVVFLDDDEVIEDPDFLVKGMYGLGKLTKRGIPILVKTGYYLNSKDHSIRRARTNGTTTTGSRALRSTSGSIPPCAVRVSRVPTTCAAAAWPCIARRSSA